MIALKPARTTLPTVATEVLTSIHQHRLLEHHTGPRNAPPQPHAPLGRTDPHAARPARADRVRASRPRRTTPLLPNPRRGAGRRDDPHPRRDTAQAHHPRAGRRPALATHPRRQRHRHRIHARSTRTQRRLRRARLAPRDRPPRPRHRAFSRRAADRRRPAYLPRARARRAARVSSSYLELDRATVPADTLAAKLARYADLYHAPIDRGQPSGKLAWQARYPIFPDIICVLAGNPRPVLLRRAQTVLALCQADPQLQRTPRRSASP